MTLRRKNNRRVEERPITNQIFAENMDRLMIREGLTNSRLCQWLNVSRETVGKYRSGLYLPSTKTLEVLCMALNCEQDELFEEQQHQDVTLIPIAEWARREGIPVSRARDLFTLGVLHGAVHTQVGSMIVPETITAPADSKWLVRIAKVRPPWVPAFWANFPTLLDRRRGQQGYCDIANAADVTPGAVYHWVHGLGYPKEERLPLIAEALGCSVPDLISPAPQSAEAA